MVVYQTPANKLGRGFLSALGLNALTELHLPQLVLFLLQRKNLIGYLAEVRHATFKIILGLGDFWGTSSDPSVRSNCDGS
jgi:hypothetical protein